MPTRLAEIVVDTELVDRDELMEVVKWADEKKLPLIAALVRQKGIDELALVGAIRRHVRVPIVDPAQVEQEPEATQLLSRPVCWRLRVVPLSLSEYDAGPRGVRLAMADPTDAIAIAEVEHLTGCQVETALMPLSAIEELVEISYADEVTDVIPRKRPNAKRRPGTKSEVVQVVPDDQGTVPISTRPPPPDKKSPTTTPFHRVSDEASLETRHRALLELLIEKNVLTEEEYQERVRALMKRRADDA